uniref:Rho GTPase activating protein 4 n=1 Tax=Macaca fascicularis TaxID=9541 RepID=A0A2K5WP87_MACFA
MCWQGGHGRVCLQVSLPLYPQEGAVTPVALALLGSAAAAYGSRAGRAALSEVLAGPLAQRLSHIAEDVGRLVKKSRDLEQQLQDELLEVVSELQTAKKTYQAYHMESVNAEAKLREAERQEEKRAGRSVPTTTAAATEAGPLRKSSLKKGGRLVEKRQAKFMEHKLKCTKARNEYLLSLASVNAAVSNYYLHDVLDLMDCCDTGFHLALGQVLRSYMAAESRTQASQVQGLGSLEEAVEALDPSGDKAKVLEVHATIFCPPLRFDYHPHDGDEVAEICVEMELQDEILPRAQNIQSRLDRQTIETEEVNKTLKATLQALLEVVASDDGDVLDSFQTSPSTESLKSTSSDPGSRQAGRRRGQQQETETFYLTKLQEYLSGRSILAKLQAKHEKLQEALQRGDKEEREMSWTQYTQRKFQKSRHPRPSSQYNQRLFGGDMEKFIQCSGQPVPLVVESCIRFINLNGLQHEGIFRVSGAQLRVSEIRDAFERGEDPLVEGCTAHDLDSVAGVLKLYFRSLEPPLFPPDLFSELLASSELEATAERVEHVSRLLWRLPAPVLVVLRYLFNFLNHLAQYSDENMMDPYNLAVCFGPTLLPVPAGQDPVALQGRVNQLVQTLILQPDRVFPPLTSLPGPVYEKCMAPPSASCLGDAQLESLGADNEPELEAEMLAQEDDLEGVVEAVACFAYTGRTAQELSFRGRACGCTRGPRATGGGGSTMVCGASSPTSISHCLRGQSHASHPRPWDSLDIDDAAWSQPPRSNTWRWIRLWHRTWTLCLRSSWERPLSPGPRASICHLSQPWAPKPKGTGRQPPGQKQRLLPGPWGPSLTLSIPPPGPGHNPQATLRCCCWSCVPQAATPWTGHSPQPSCFSPTLSSKFRVPALHPVQRWDGAAHAGMPTPQPACLSALAQTPFGGWGKPSSATLWRAGQWLLGGRCPCSDAWQGWVVIHKDLVLIP